MQINNILLSFRRFGFLSLPLLGIVGVSIFPSCSYETETVVSSAEFPVEIAEIVNASCATTGCHVGSNSPENLRLEDWNRLFEGSDFGAVLVPNEPDWSHFFKHLNTFEDLGVQARPVMPPGGLPKLERGEVETLRNWILQGAPNAKGELRWSQREVETADKAFTLCAGSDLVAVSDLRTNLIMRFIEVGQEEGKQEAPHYIRLSPDQQFFYVSLIDGGFIEKYRTDNYAFEGRVEVGPDPSIIEVSPDGTRAIITHWNASDLLPKLSMINTEDMSIVDQVQGGAERLSFPHGIAANADYSMVYITANEGNYYAKYGITPSGFVTEEKVLLGPDVQPAIDRPSSSFKPYECELSADGNLLFMTLNETDEVRVYQTSNDSLIAQISTGEFPRLLVVDENSNKLFVACANEENFAEQGSIRGSIAVIDINTLTLEKQIFRVGQRPHGLAIDSESNVLVVSSENNGGQDPPHHVLEGTSGPPGKYNFVDLTTLAVIPDAETEVAVFPNAVVVSE